MNRLLAMIAGADTARGHDTPVSKTEAALFFFSLLGLMALAFWMQLELPVALALLAVLGGLLVMQSAVTWLALSVFGFVGVFWRLEPGLTPPEIAHTVVYYGGLLWWFFHRLVIARTPLRWSTGGLLTLAVFFQLLLMGPVSIGYGADPYVWLREMVIVSTPLILVPIAHECDTRPKQYIVLGALVAAMTAYGLRNIYLYKQKVVEAVWMWQVGASRASETVFFVFALALLGTALLVSARGRRQTLLFAAIFALGVSTTVLSFYRTIWVGTLFGWGVMAMTMGRDFRRRAVKYAAVSVIVLAVAYPIVLADVVPLDVMWTSISSRFESIGEFRTDVSVTNRDAEARAMLDDIGPNWLFGKGMSTTIHFTKLTSMTTIAPTWTHNGYAWILNHLGIIGTALYFASLLAYVLKGRRIELRLRALHGPGESDLYRIRALAAAAVAFVLSIFVVSYALNSFLTHEAGMVLGVLFGLLEVWDREGEKGRGIEGERGRRDEVTP